MKVLIVGLNPSKKHGDSPSLRTLYKWTDQLQIPRFSFTNLYLDYKIIKNKSQLKNIKEYSKNYDKVVALGQVVSGALQSVDIDHYKLPHPSGLNRRLNDPKYVHEQLQSCKNYLYGDN